MEGSIPARAGEPHITQMEEESDKVYPRACGGTQRQQYRRANSAGLSPRVRGNPETPRPNGGRSRSIPARAGEPAPP